jgi:hypothetical protein
MAEQQSNHSTSSPPTFEPTRVPTKLQMLSSGDVEMMESMFLSYGESMADSMVRTFGSYIASKGVVAQSSAGDFAYIESLLKEYSSYMAQRQSHIPTFYPTRLPGADSMTSNFASYTASSGNVYMESREFEYGSYVEQGSMELFSVASENAYLVSTNQPNDAASILYDSLSESMLYTTSGPGDRTSFVDESIAGSMMYLSSKFNDFSESSMFLSYGESMTDSSTGSPALVHYPTPT